MPPASGLPDTPEKASEPPHCSAIRRPASGSSVRTSASTASIQPRTIFSPAASPAARPPPTLRNACRTWSSGKPVLAHVRLEPRVGDWLDAEIERQDRADVRVDHEPGQRAQHLGGVVRLAGAAALGVGDGDDAVDPGVRLGQRLQPRRELARDAGGARRRAQDHDGVARPDAAAARPPVAAERARPGDVIDRLAGPVGRRVERERHQVVLEVRRRGQRHAELTHGQRLQDRGVADVVAGRDRDQRVAERQPPREQRLARRDRPDRQAVPLEHARGERADGAVDLDLGAGVESADGDGDVVVRRGQAADGGQRQRRGHLFQQTTRNFGAIVQKHRVQSQPGSAAAPTPGAPVGRPADPGPLADHPDPVRGQHDQLRRSGDAVDRRHRPVARPAARRGHPRLPALGVLLELRRAADSWRLAARPPGLAARLPVEPARLVGLHDGPGRRRAARDRPRRRSTALFGLRLGLGAAEAPSFPANSRLVAVWFPTAERGLASAIFNASQYFSTVLFYPVMGTVTHHLRLAVGVRGDGRGRPGVRPRLEPSRLRAGRPPARQRRRGRLHPPRRRAGRSRSRRRRRPRRGPDWSSSCCGSGCCSASSSASTASTC